MAKNNLLQYRQEYKIENIKYAIEVENSYIEQIRIDEENKKKLKIEKRIIQDKKKLFPHELKAYGKEEFYNLEKLEKLEKYLKKLDLRIRFEKQKYSRQVKAAGENDLENIELEYKNRIFEINALKENYVNELDKHYDGLILVNGPDKSYEKVYQDLLKKVNEDFELFNNNLDALTKSRVQTLVDKAKKRIRKLEEELKIMQDNTQDNTSNNYLNPGVALRLEGVSMQFGGLKAVDNLSFEVKENQIFGLIGPNGAGKTTVFNCITQFYKPTSGNIYFNDKYGNQINLNDLKIHNVIKHGIVRTFQNVELIWELSVLDNLLVAGHTKYRSNLFEQMFHSQKYKREELVIKAKAEKILKNLNLEDYKYFVPAGLPYGILKRIELARTLMVDPKLIILDEPAAGLNAVETKELANTIVMIKGKFNCTIFLVEHDMSLVMEICDTICAINFGKRICIGNPEEVQKDKQVQEAYLGGE